MKNKEERIKKVAAFANALEKSNIHKFDLDNFISRLRMQKYVYLAGFFGLNFGYVYNLYLRGPYSSDLAEDYYRLKELGEVENLSIFGDNFEIFAKLVKGKDHIWLEIASTIKFIWERNRRLRLRYKWSREELANFAIKRTTDIKSHVGKSFIKDVYEELEKAGLLTN